MNGRGAAFEGERGYFREFVGTPGSKQESSAFGGERKCGGCANSGTGAGYEDNLSVQAHAFILIVIRG
jgi:hypothetical protein